MACDSGNENALDVKFHNFLLHFIGIDKKTKNSSFESHGIFLVSHEESVRGETIRKTLRMSF